MTYLNFYNLKSKISNYCRKVLWRVYSKHALTTGRVVLGVVVPVCIPTSIVPPLDNINSSFFDYCYFIPFLLSSRDATAAFAIYKKNDGV